MCISMYTRTHGKSLLCPISGAQEALIILIMSLRYLVPNAFSVQFGTRSVGCELYQDIYFFHLLFIFPFYVIANSALIHTPRNLYYLLL